jgi:NTP pyrophosphatase (non-canonical NTP hydrolase)
MQINLSDEMIKAVIEALRLHIAQHGKKTYGFASEDEVTNEEALELFEECLKPAGKKS